MFSICMQSKIARARQNDRAPSLPNSSSTNHINHLLPLCSMNRNHVIKFVVTKDQKQSIWLNAQASGYSTISGFMRALALNLDAGFMHKFNKLYEKIMGEDNGKNTGRIA